MFEISTNLQSVLTDTIEKSLKNLNDLVRVNDHIMLRSLNYEHHKAKTGETKSFRYKYTGSNLEKHVKKNLGDAIQKGNDSDDSDFEAQRSEKSISPYSIIVIFTGLEFLLG